MDRENINNYKNLLPEKYRNATPKQIAAGHGGGDFFIVEDLINAIRTNTQPEFVVHKACEWTALSLLSNLFVTNGGKTMKSSISEKLCPLRKRESFLTKKQGVSYEIYA